MMISHMYIDRMTFSTCAIAPIKLPSTYMIFLVTPQTSVNKTRLLRQRVGHLVLKNAAERRHVKIKLPMTQSNTKVAI